MAEIQLFARALKHRLALPLPGREGQLVMAHAERRLNLSRYRIPENARQGAVLILFYEEDYQLKFPLILRESGTAVHSGQVSLPGGKFEEGDPGMAETALRETEEEIQMPRGEVEVIGKLTDLYIPPSNFQVHPFVGIARTQPHFVPQPGEVADVITVTTDQLANDALVKEKEIVLSNGLRITTPCFELNGHIVWGATAMMLNELKIILREIAI